jgi:hypothetical protein
MTPIPVSLKILYTFANGIQRFATVNCIFFFKRYWNCGGGWVEAVIDRIQFTNWVIGGLNGAAARLGLKRTTLHCRMEKRHQTPQRSSELRIAVVSGCKLGYRIQFSSFRLGMTSKCFVLAVTRVISTWRAVAAIRRSSAEIPRP